jgi:hypothetical protein
MNPLRVFPVGSEVERPRPDTPLECVCARVGVGVGVDGWVIACVCVGACVCVYVYVCVCVYLEEGARKVREVGELQRPAGFERREQVNTRREESYFGGEKGAP